MTFWEMYLLNGVGIGIVILVGVYVMWQLLRGKS